MNARTIQLLGEDNFSRLSAAHILIVGLGGVGAWAAEMIARAGVGELTIVDADKVSPSNINRQLVALHSTIGQAKAQVLAARLRDINPGIKLTVIEDYIKDDKTTALLCSARFDYVVDAIDTLSPKVNPITECLRLGLPVVSSMGAGAKVDPTKIEVGDISKTHHCPLAHALRKRLHRQGVREGFMAVFSSEAVCEGAIIECDDEPNKKSSIGSISYLPAAFGCVVASVVVRELVGCASAGASGSR
ncbi:MAG: tRNA threonylcarbamoyladenosine dehydratase [Mucinivorans sp.]